MLFLLALFLLLPASNGSGIDIECEANSACLLFSWSLRTGATFATVKDVTLNNTHESDLYIWLAVRPETPRRWIFDVRASFFSLAEFKLFFGSNYINFVNDSTVELTVDGGTTEHSVVSVRDAQISYKLILEDEKKLWLQQFHGNISIESPAWNVAPTEIPSFWNALGEKTPCFVEEISDACPNSPEDCDKLAPTPREVPCTKNLWLNQSEGWLHLSGVRCVRGEWTAISVSSPSAIAVDKRGLLCAAAQPSSRRDEGICEQQEILNRCNAGCDKLTATSRRVECAAKFWLNTDEGTLANDWQLVRELRCVDGRWQWRAEEGAGGMRLFEKQSLACTYDTPQHFKAVFYIVVGCGGALGLAVIAIVAVIACCFCRRGGRRPSRSRKSSSASNKRHEMEETSLGVKVKVARSTKKEEKTWTWSREQRAQAAREARERAAASQDSSSNVSSTGQVESSGEEEKKEQGKRRSGRKKGESKVKRSR